MKNAPDEAVLVIPTARLHAVGSFHGFQPITERLRSLLDPHYFAFLPRSQVEVDPSWKQLIPYVVLRHANRVFHYRRAGGTETRLRALRSIGIGGHISREDAHTDDVYRTGMYRELQEEVTMSRPLSERLIGLINDDRTPVGQVHLGIVHLIDLESAQVRLNEAGLVAGGFASATDLLACRDEFETWSQFTLEALLAIDSPTSRA